MGSFSESRTDRWAFGLKGQGSLESFCLVYCFATRLRGLVSPSFPEPCGWQALAAQHMPCPVSVCWRIEFALQLAFAMEDDGKDATKVRGNTTSCGLRLIKVEVK